MNINNRRLNKDPLSHGHDVKGSLEKNQRIVFGHYPQSQVTDSTLITKLNNAAGKLPKPGHDELWTDYGYYLNGKVESYMWHIDLVVGSHKYRGVYFTSYRPSCNGCASPTSTSNQGDKGYNTNNVYWFIYEPITWRVLDIRADKALLLADLALDSQDYHYSDFLTISKARSAFYANNYKKSHIRLWLNDHFYYTAFSHEEKARIQTTAVDNGLASTGYSSNRYVCGNIKDKVFLLSYDEATSARYGLGTTVSRQRSSSDYAKSQGISTEPNGYQYWWLRSPSDTIGFLTRSVCADGDVDDATGVDCTDGVVPALRVSL